jgi:YVTN family beta-propeller protein
MPRGRASRRVALAGGAVAVAAAIASATGVLLTRGGPGSAVAAHVSANAVGIFDAEHGDLGGEIQLGASPRAVASGDGSLWAANVDAGTVSRIDPVNHVVTQTIQVGSGPAGIAYGGGFVWVANSRDGTVWKIDPQTNTTVQRIPVGKGPAALAVGSRYLWVANSGDGTVTRIDLRTGKPLPRIPVDQSADGIAVGFGSVWVTSGSTGTVTRIDERTGKPVATIPTGSGAGAVAVGNGAVWVANSLAGTVSRIDPATDDAGAAIPVRGRPNGIAAAPGAVWVSSELTGTLSRIDPERNTVVHEVNTGNRPEGVVFDSGELFVAVRDSGAGHRGGTLRIRGYVDHLEDDPAQALGVFQEQVFALTNDGLTGFRRVGGAAGYQLEPDLAVRLPAPADGDTSYTFRLRPGIRYSTGALVRPEDFRRAIERSLVVNPVLVNLGYYMHIRGASSCAPAAKRRCDLSEGIEVNSAANTITFHLTAPDRYFLYELALPYAFAVPAGTPPRLHRPIPATGPYMFASFRARRGIRLVRNPRFREWSPAAQPNGFPESIVWRIRGSHDAHVTDVLHGSADLAFDASRASPSLLESVRTQHASRLEVNPWDGTWFLVLNTRAPPFDDKRVRRALNFAVDRVRLRDLALGQGLGSTTCQVLPPNLDGYEPYCPYTVGPKAAGTWSAPDLERAQRLVRASGTAGQRVTVWLPDYTGIPASAGRYVASVLDRLGYRARFRFAPDPLGREDELHVQIGFSGESASFPKPASFIGEVLTCGADDPVHQYNSNSAEFCDPAIDREVARAQSLEQTDPERASRLWAKIDRDLTDAAPWVSFANGAQADVVSAKVRNYQFNPRLGVLLDQLWVK